MKKTIKIVSSLVVFGSLFLSTAFNDSIKAESNIGQACNYVAQPGVNPDYKTMNCLLTETALQYNVPPEIIKAVAENESAWKQYKTNGEPLVTSDNGIGVMQITNQKGLNEDRLKNDILYNIEEGVKLLDSMFKRTDLPSINNKDRSVLEHWYFAIMAYNGTKPVNSPIVQSTGKPNVGSDGAYQEKIYQYINELSLTETASLPFKKEDFQYDPNSTENIHFVTMDYHFNVPFTKSKYYFKEDQKVETTAAVTLRSSATKTDTNGIRTLNYGEIVTITGPFQYDIDPTKRNHFVWYPVQRSDGSKGFVASGYIKLRFHDVPAGHYAESQIEYLVDRGILNGVGNDHFGLNQPLKRVHAVILLTRAENVALENRPDPRFSDVPKDHDYYNEIAAAVDEGLFDGVSETSFDPDGTLTRAQMAVVLQRIYKFPEAVSKQPFTDVKYEWWFGDAVARLYASGITDGVTATEFAPGNDVTREQFAVFMVRAMEDSYRLK